MARDYVPAVWVNEPAWILGDPELDAANMNRIENQLDKLDKEGKNYDSFNWYRPYFATKNQKEISNNGTIPTTTVETGWSLTGCTCAAVSSGTFIHDKGIKFIESDNTASTVNGYKAITRIYADTFPSGDNSATSDYIELIVNIQDVTKVNVTAGNGILLSLGTDISNHYRKYFNTQGDGSALVTGWNRLYAKKSDFTTSGSPAWNNIVWVQLGWVTLVNSINKFVEFHCIRLVRKNAAGTAPDDMGVSDDNGTTFVSRFPRGSGISVFTKDTAAAVNDISLVTIGTPSITSVRMSLQTYNDVTAFMHSVCKITGYSASLTWYVDANNYIECAIKADVFTVNVRYAGSTTTLTKNMLSSFTSGKYVWMTLQKIGARIQVRLETSTGLTDTLYITATQAYTGLLGHLYLGGTTANQQNAIVQFYSSQTTNI